MLLVIPVIIMHRGESDYVNDVVAQARKRAQNVVVLGDGQNFATDRQDKYCESAKAFEGLYEHLSTNGYNIELMCFTRWFILKDYMKVHGINVCLHLDSDVLLYIDPEDIWMSYDQFDITLSHRCCGSAAFFTLKGLEKFCSFIMDTYTEKNSYDYSRLVSHYQTRQKHGLTGGVCDMTLLEHYGYKHCGEIGEMMHIIGSSAWDHNINEPDQGFMIDPATGIKRITFIKGMPTGYQETTDRVIKFNSLHFQGPAKRYIKRHLTI